MNVSVLLPIYDAARTLAACLASIVRQRVDFECIMVDDGSRDASAAIAAEVATRDARFVLVSRPHGGLVEALNAGIDACRAPWIARMDADDIMHRDRLAAQLGWLEDHPTLAGAGSRVRLFPRDTLRDGMLRYERWLNTMTTSAVARDAYIECPLAHPTWMIRRDVLATLRYRDEGWPEDWDLLHRMLEEGHQLGVVPRRLLFWRDRPERMTRTHPTLSQARFTACRAHHLATRFLASHARYVLWGYGETGKALRRELATHDKHPAAIVELHPGRIGQRIFGAPVIAPDGLSGYRGLPLLASVAGTEARALIARALVAQGWIETRDFVCCA